MGVGEMRGFSYRGRIPASKSLVNRLLICQSFNPELSIEGDSHCEDVLRLRQCLENLDKGGPFDCGEGGTTLRFLAFRLSREKGEFTLRGSPELLGRPQEDLVQVLQELGVEVQLDLEALHLKSEGWKKPSKPIEVGRESSSQFLSGLALSAWSLPFDLELIPGKGLSQSYWKMTYGMLEKLGLQMDRRGDRILIAAGQRPRPLHWVVEPDMGSAFALAALATLCGELELEDCPRDSLQPDSVFPEVLAALGAEVDHQGSRLKVRKASQLTGIQWDLSNTPDLFPTLSTLCAFAEGDSHLYGAPHLVHKESNRIQGTARLLRGVGRPFRVLEGGIKITGSLPKEVEPFEFDPSRDHRMVFAAGLVKGRGLPIQILDPMAVNKSFPEYWAITGLRQGQNFSYG